PLALAGPFYASRNYLPVGGTAHASDFLVTGYTGLKFHYPLRGYADLAAIDPGQRGLIFFPKIVSDQVAGAFTGIWLGMALCLVSGVGMGILQTLTAGYLLRNRERVLTILFPYIA